MSSNELERKGQELKELLAEIDELTEQAESLKDEIKRHMTEQELDEVRGKGWKAFYKPVTSERLDVKAVKEHAPATYDKFVKYTTGYRFIIK